MTIYEKRQKKLLTKTALSTLMRDLNIGSKPSKNGWGIALLDEKNDAYDVLAYFPDKETAKRVRRILRSIMHKSFDQIHTLNLVENKDMVA